MDLEQMKKFIKKKIESDNVSKEVRDIIKITNWQKQDSREGFTESFKPLIESQEKVSEEINKQKKETIDQLRANQEAITKSQLALTDGIKRLALEYNKGEGEDGAKGEDGDDKFEDALEKLDKGGNKAEDVDDEKKVIFKIKDQFNEKDIDYLQKLGLKNPNTILYLSNEEIKDEIKKANIKIKKLNGDKLSYHNKKEYDKKESADNLQKLIQKYKDISKLYLEGIEKLKVGEGIYFNNPNQLIDRLELLIGSLLAGNNGVIPEFFNILYILNKNKLISKKKLNSLIKNISLKHNIQI